MKNLKDYVNAHKTKADEYLKITFDFDKLSQEEIFYKIVFCILVPGGKASRAREAVEELKKKNFFYKSFNKTQIYNIIKSKARFPRLKAERLHELNKDLLFATIYYAKSLSVDGSHVRVQLVKNIKGIGYKAASHFLRNLGYRDIAIIDVHILKYRKYYMPKDQQNVEPTSETKYAILEKNFTAWAKKEFNLDPILLDWLIWTYEGNYQINEFEY